MLRKQLRYTSVLAALALLCALTSSCKKRECVDCHEPGSNHFFTFCDPAEPAIEGLDCGEVYTD